MDSVGSGPCSWPARMALAVLLVAPACETMRTPVNPHNFRPQESYDIVPADTLIGTQRVPHNCRPCGTEALARCESGSAGSFPRWYGFDSEGVCNAQCTFNGGNQYIGTLRGKPGQACIYRLDMPPLQFNGPVCPTDANLARGDREFDGHGPWLQLGLTGRVSPDGRRIMAVVQARWTELDRASRRWAGDGTDVDLSPRVVAMSRDLGSDYLGNPVRVRQHWFNGLFESRYMEDSREALEDFSGRPYVWVVGDTSGLDVSDDDDCNDDTRIDAIDFPSYEVEIGPPGP